MPVMTVDLSSMFLECHVWYIHWNNSHYIARRQEENQPILVREIVADKTTKDPFLVRVLLIAGATAKIL